jgi:hypothetical protein
MSLSLVNRLWDYSLGTMDWSPGEGLHSLMRSTNEAPLNKRHWKPHVAIQPAPGGIGYRRNLEQSNSAMELPIQFSGTASQ